MPSETNIDTENSAGHLNLPAVAGAHLLKTNGNKKSFPKARNMNIC